jgi:hypothetical protein
VQLNTGSLAQLAEHLLDTQGVTGSSPVAPTIPENLGAESTAPVEPQAPQPSHQETPRTPPRWKFWKSAWSFGLGLATLWVGYVELWPAIKVEAASSLAADDPYEPRFTVTNVGYLRVYELGFGCLITMPIHPNVPGPMNFELGINDRANAEAGNNTAAEPFLAPQDYVVKTCPIRVANETPANIALVGATIDFCVSFRPFAPSFPVMNGFVLNKVARFISRKDPSGGIVWIPAQHPEICPLSLPPWKRPA